MLVTRKGQEDKSRGSMKRPKSHSMISDGIDSFRCEVKAVLRAVQDHKEIMETTELRFLLDNKIVIDQLRRKAAINHEDTRSDFLEIWNLTAGKKVIFGWIPRKQNKAGKMLGS
jgi:ribonuclease HI